MTQPNNPSQRQLPHAPSIPQQLPLFRFDELPADALIRQKELIVYSIVPFSASTLWRRIKSQEFPYPIRVSSGITAWRVGDLREWLKNPTQYRAGGAR